MTDYYFHEKEKSIENLPISRLVRECLRSLPAKRIPVNQVFDDFERRNGIDILRSRKSYLQCLQWWPGVFHGDCSLSTTAVCFPSLLNHPSFDPSFACCEGTLRNAALVFKSCFPPWHKQGISKVIPSRKCSVLCS